MKTTTRSGRGGSRHPNWHLVAWLAPLSLVLAACATFGLREFRPAELAGEWIDVARSTPADTFVWLLRPSGEDRTLHIRGGVSDSRRSGSWHVSGRSSDGSRRGLCFSGHPGRSPASCVAFRMDTVSRRGGPQRRLILMGYPGRRHVGERTLLERVR